MLVTTSPLQVLHVGPYSNPGNPNPLIWGAGQGQYAGSMIEKLILLDPAEHVVLDNFTLAPYLGSADVKEGDRVVLDCEVSVEAVSVRVVKYKWRVVAVRPAPATAVTASAGKAAA